MKVSALFLFGGHEGDNMENIYNHFEYKTVARFT